MTLFLRQFTTIIVLLGSVVLGPSGTSAQCLCNVRQEFTPTVSPKWASGNRSMVRYADLLYQQQMFFRAVGAYKMAEYFSDDPRIQLSSCIGAALSYHMGRQYDRAMAEYSRAIDMSCNESRVASLKISREVASCELARARKNTLGMVSCVENLKAFPTLQKQEIEAYRDFNRARFLVALGREDEAKAIVHSWMPPCKTEEYRSCVALSDFDVRLQTKKPSKKSRMLGTVLSAFVPGAGAVYSEHYVDAIYYFAGISGAGLLTWDVANYDRPFLKQTPTFYVTLAIGSALWLANVIQGYSMVGRWNAIEEHRYRNSMQSGLLPPVPEDRFELRPVETLGPSPKGEP